MEECAKKLPHVVAIQDSDIKIYSVDNGWKVKKNIRARSLRWTITDTSLSPDQRFLIWLRIYFKITCVVSSLATKDGGFLESLKRTKNQSCPPPPKSSKNRSYIAQGACRNRREARAFITSYIPNSQRILF